MNTLVVGQIKSIGELETFRNSDFKKRTLIVETVEEFPNNFSIEISNEKLMNDLDNLKVGQNVKVKCNLKGREVLQDGKDPLYFTSLKGWNIS